MVMNNLQDGHYLQKFPQFEQVIKHTKLNYLLLLGFSVLMPWAFIRFCKIKPAESEVPNKRPGRLLGFGLFSI